MKLFPQVLCLASPVVASPAVKRSGFGDGQPINDEGKGAPFSGKYHQALNSSQVSELLQDLDIDRYVLIRRDEPCH